MLSFIKFNRYLKEEIGYQTLFEALNNQQKQIVDSWGRSPNAENISGHVIPPGQDRITIPLETPDKKEIEPHPDVVKHLTDTGFQVADYAAGTAKDKFGRTIKIGKALEKSGAPKELKDTFNSDPARRGAKSIESGLQVVVSRHPHDVAGMSTGQGWRSCMTMGGDGDPGGINQHYLQRDVNAGTHVAYLTHKGDHDASKPLARIALKPFHGTNQEGTILRPESETYGTADSAFGHTVRNWTENHFPMHPEGEYAKDKTLYNDDGRDTIRSFGATINHANPSVRARAFVDYPDRITPEHISSAIADNSIPGRVVKAAALQHPMATDQQLSDALDPSQRFHFRHAVVMNPSAKPEHIDKALQDKDRSVREAAASHINASKDNLTRAISDSDEDVRMSALEHPRADVTHFTKALDDQSDNVRRIAVNHPSMTEIVNQKLTSADPNDHHQAMNIAKVTRDKNLLTQTATSHPDPIVRMAAISNGHTPIEAFGHMAQHDTFGPNREYAQNKLNMFAKIRGQVNNLSRPA